MTVGSDVARRELERIRAEQACEEELRRKGIKLKPEAVDAFAAMATFLSLENPCKFTEADRESLRADMEWLAACVGQMNSGQKKYGNTKSHDFREMDWPIVRMMVGMMRLYLSGKIDMLEVDA